jgi:hypothetical protein
MLNHAWNPPNQLISYVIQFLFMDDAVQSTKFHHTKAINLFITTN